MGGIIIGIRKEIIKKETKMKLIKEGIMTGMVRNGKNNRGIRRKECIGKEAIDLGKMDG